MLTTDEILNSNVEKNIEAMVRRTMIVDYGIIEKVYSNRVIQVTTSCYIGDVPVSITCMYLTFASSSLVINSSPKEGDKVLLVSPKLFSPQMFTAEESKYLEDVNGYNLASVIAIPIWSKVKNKNNTTVITATDEEFSITSEKPINLNGDSKSLVTYEALNEALTELWNKIKTHTHPATSGTTSASTELATATLDLSGAEATKVKTS